MSESPEQQDPDTTASASEPRIDDVIASSDDGGAVVGDAQGVDHADRPDALDEGPANRIAARNRQTVFVLAGGPECGKTSAYAALYERLGRGPFAGRMFAGSQTILGFEKRCHYWRTSSMLEGWSMRHTQAEDLPWLHLRLRDLAAREPIQDLLLGDFDGEFFRALINNDYQPSKLPFLRRADHVGVVLNGAKLARAATRESQYKDAINLVNQLYKDPEHAPVSAMLVVTMIDLIADVEDTRDQAAIEELIQKVHGHIQQVAGREVPVVRLAVRSENEKFPLGHGLEDLLELLKVRSATHVPTAPPELQGTNRLSEFRA
jgi:hypothetical protein